jgi:hypothetical protein
LEACKYFKIFNYRIEHITKEEESGEEYDSENEIIENIENNNKYDEYFYCKNKNNEEDMESDSTQASKPSKSDELNSTSPLIKKLCKSFNEGNNKKISNPILCMRKASNYLEDKDQLSKNVRFNSILSKLEMKEEVKRKMSQIII